MVCFIVGAILIIIASLVIKGFKDLIDDNPIFKKIIIAIVFIGIILWLVGLSTIYTTR